MSKDKVAGNLTSATRHYLAAVLHNGGLNTKHAKVLATVRQDSHAFVALLQGGLVRIEHGRIYATAAGCVAFGPEVA